MCITYCTYLIINFNYRNKIILILIVLQVRYVNHMDTENLQL